MVGSITGASGCLHIRYPNSGHLTKFRELHGCPELYLFKNFGQTWIRKRLPLLPHLCEQRFQGFRIYAAGKQSVSDFIKPVEYGLSPLPFLSGTPAIFVHFLKGQNTVNRARCAGRSRRCRRRSTGKIAGEFRPGSRLGLIAAANGIALNGVCAGDFHHEIP
jgi:hypothetical protein